MAEEVVERLGLGPGELTRKLDQLGVALAHASAHDGVIAGGVGLVLEHQVVAVVEEQLLVRAAHRGQHVLALHRRATVVVVSRCLPERVGHSLEAAFDRGKEELALVGEEAEHVRLGDAYAAGDAIDRGSVQTTAGELVDGRGDQLLPPLGRGTRRRTGSDVVFAPLMNAKISSR